MTRTTLIQASLLTGTLFLNTGCFFGYFSNPLAPVEKPVSVARTTSAPVVNIIRPSAIQTVECTDDINSPNSCNKGLISRNELKPKKSQTVTGGEVHQLRSFQGHPITIVERSNGFIFPQYKNKVVILEMFGKKCSHCIKEMPIFNKIRHQYRGKVEIISVQVEDKMTPREAQALIKKHHIQYPVISGETATNLQYAIQDTYGWTGILPYTLVVKNGVTEFNYPGSVSYRELNNDLASIIK